MPDQTLRIADVVDSTESEGPEERLAIWVQGCQRRCPECCNPEMWDEAGGREVSVTDLLAHLERAETIEGITLLGGEPFEQAGALAIVAERAQTLGLGVMAFTGYTLEELEGSPKPAIGRLLAALDLLVDGPFVQEERSERRRWIGSENQRLHFLTDRYHDHPDIREDSTQSVHITFEDGQIVVTGWPGLAEQLERDLEK